MAFSELCAGLYKVLRAPTAGTLHKTLHPYEGLDVMPKAVRHQVKGAVWRDEGDGSVRFERCQLHALVEPNVFQLDSSSVATTLGFEQQLVVEPQTTRGHSGQVRPHLESAFDLC